ncbi:hypothetical protein KAW43_01505 [Candidatus Parcubacteria bacterium]|nr:hypothetical protein [Candidatus Parcubacteria bacterium]
MIKSKNAEKKQNNKRGLDEAKNNLLGFFDLLLKIDTRNNPQNYTKKSKIKNK